MNRKVGLELIQLRGFVGILGGGKTYSCQQLIDNEGYIQIDFADGLRDMTWRLLNWTPKNSEEYDLFKKGLINIPDFGRVNGRAMLQKLGQMMRELDDSFWVNLWKSKIDKAISMGYTKICTSDIRYTNEMDKMKSFNWQADVKITFCDYHSNRYDPTNNHISEQLAQSYLKQGYKDGDLIYGRE